MFAARRVVVFSVAHALLAAVGCGGARLAGGAPPANGKGAPSASSSAAPAAQTLHWTGKLGAGKVMDLHTVAGTIRAVAASDDVAVLDATLASSAQPDPRTTLRVHEGDRGVSLRAETSDDGCRCDDHDHEHDHEHGRFPAVDVVVRVPAGVRLVVHTVEARIDAEGLKGTVDLHTVDGTIDARGLTNARAHTVNGAIKVTFAQPDLAEDSELSTVNGTVELTLPVAANADLVAETVNGQVRLDQPPGSPLDSRGLRVTLGKGGRALRLRTVNGMISVKRQG